MTVATILGFAGDTLTFLGGLILAIDAVGRDREFTKQQELGKAVADLKSVELTKDGIKLTGAKSIEHVFIRQSVRRALWGTGIMTIGFISLLAARFMEAVGRAAEHCS
jgi:hypothetical protein